MPNLFDKGKYVIHYEYLQFYLRLGLKLKEMHRLLEFSQSRWLKQFVEFNKKKEQKQKKCDKDGKALYKLMNNAVYRKTMENLRSTVDVKLVSNKKGYLKMTSRPIYRSHKIIYKELVAIRKNKVTLALNKTGYIQMCILELKKC